LRQRPPAPRESTSHRRGVAVTVSEHDGWVNLQVSDTGIGIPRDQIPLIFERFYRTDEARTAGGSGLGLSIARQIAEAHGGTIAVESKLDEGSTFVLRIPGERIGSKAPRTDE
jgi:signal transduction histidine kinase